MTKQLKTIKERLDEFFGMVKEEHKHKWILFKVWQASHGWKNDRAYFFCKGCGEAKKSLVKEGK